MSDCGQVAA